MTSVRYSRQYEPADGVWTGLPTPGQWYLAAGAPPVDGDAQRWHEE
ncbi:hypothetical protein [Haloarcula salinisoli]|uniref:Uncharacterized protein n=1 Tax=Haloarcula salinisoli TaxID=2487746 RepID=A0A8J7YQ38_9EURY|nr:hypothetical protein [Halomicroarcula salinisoli]MBX0305273.1 hypothetical protein [Halomicroarcula salinisoli]